MAPSIQKLFTLVFLKRNDSILLGLKTRGFGRGLWNGFGGKLEPGESIDVCARRELYEECNLSAKVLKQIGVVKYIQENAVDIVHIFTCQNFDGTIVPSDEMNPVKWYDIKDIPFEQMWPDSKSWYPLMLSDKFFSAVVVYNSQGVVESKDIREQQSLVILITESSVRPSPRGKLQVEKLNPKMAPSIEKIFTLVFLKKNDSILLGLKTRGLGCGLWNGFGGKLEPDESIDACAQRELYEECNLNAKVLKQIGVVKYIRENAVHVVHIFTCQNFEGTITPSEEMNPVKWYEIKDIPFNQMWPDSKSWYPLMLKEKFFSAVVVYNSQDVVESEDIRQQHNLCTVLDAIK